MAVEVPNRPVAVVAGAVMFKAILGAASTFFSSAGTVVLDGKRFVGAAGAGVVNPRPNGLDAASFFSSPGLD